MQPHSVKPDVKTGVTTRASAPAWRLELLGGAVLHGVVARHTLERKTAGVLALLALEGEVTRSKVAGLLWAENDEERARANLRQTLHRLKKSVGTDLVQSGERLSLTGELEVDTITLESKAFLGDDAGLIVVKGGILESFDFEDCPDFSEWLEAQRERWRGARVSAYRRALQRPDTSSDALELASEWVNLEPLSEEANRALARVHYARGNRALALQSLNKLETQLQNELGAPLSHETKALRESLEQDELVSEPVVAVLPLDIRNPPKLVGRASEWAQLERAWKAGKAVVIRGVPGVGKTRLMLDFLGSKTKFDLIEARPGDAGVPMSAFARGLRHMLSTETTLELPEWIKTELARLMPEFSVHAPPAMTSEADKLRFYEALFKVTERRLAQGINAIAIDDLQFMDAASLEALQFNTDQTLNLGVRMLTTYRKGELSAELEANIEQAASRGDLEIIDLAPLEETGLSELLTSLALEAPTNLAAQLQRSTGGNPLYALETIRDLLEQNNLQSNLERLPLPKVVQHITAQRLARRTPQAQRLAQVAAIAGEDFRLELAAFVLDCKALELQDALEELEQAQIMQRERFGHDLLLEAVRAGISNSIKRFLHRKCAAFLEEHGDPARVAQHWLEAGEYDRAVPAMIVAAENAQGMGHNQEAIKLLELAISLPANQTQVHRAQSLLGGFYAIVLRFSDAEKTLEPLLEVVSDPEAHWLTLDHLCYLHLQKGSLEMAREFGLQALQLAERRGEASNLEDTRYKLGVIAIYQADYQKAVQLIEPVVQAWRQKPVNLNFLNALGALALSLFHLERQAEAKRYDDEILRHARAIGADAIMMTHRTNQLYRDFLNGDTTQAIDAAESLLLDLEQRHSLEDTSTLRNNLAGIYSRSAQTDHAIRHYQKIVEGTNRLYLCAAHANLAVLYHQISKLELAKTSLVKALELAPDNDYHNVRYAVIRAVYTLGTPEQREIIKPYLETLNFEGLPSSYRTELDALLKLKNFPA